MLKIFHKDVKMNELKTLDKTTAGSWIYVEKPTEKDRELLVSKFSMDKGLLEDATDFYEIPRMEIEDGIIYIFTQFPYKEKDKTITSPAMFGIGESFFVTISEKSFPNIEKFEKNKIDFYTTQKTKLFLQLFSEISQEYDKHIKRITKEIRSIKIRFDNISNKDIMSFVTIEEVLNDFLSVLEPTSAVLRNLLSGKFLPLFEDDEDLVEDLILSNDQLIGICKSSLRNIASTRESYSTIMTNSLNRLIKFFTALTIILTIPTMISSIYGMNVKLPYADSPIAFFGIMASISFISIGLLVIFTRNRWL